MGNFYVNYQVRADSAEPVVAAARRACCGPAYVAPTRNGWVGVFDEASRQDQEMMHQLALDLSAGLDTAVFGFLVHDSDVFYYLLYERGSLIAEFDSWPDYHRSGGESEAEDIPSPLPRRHPDQLMLFDIGEPPEAPTPGNPEAILRHCRPGTTMGQVRDLLRQDSWPAVEAALGEGGPGHVNAMDRHAGLARLLGIDEELTYTGFRHIEETLDEEGRKELRGIRKVRGRGKKRYPRLDRPPRSLAEAVEVGDLEAVRGLLAAGASPDAKNQHRQPVLWVAAAGGHLDIAMALLASGARPQIVEGRSVEASHLLSAAVRLGRPELVPALVASGLAFRGALDDALLLAVYAHSSDRPTPEQVAALEALIRAGADVNAEGWAGRTPLTFAASSGHRQFVAVLLRMGAEIEKPGQHGRTALIQAVMREGRSRSRRIVRLLLDAGADPNARDPDGGTALMYAVAHGFHGKRARLVADLLRAGADPNAETATGQTVLSLAEGWPDSDELIALLRDAGAV